MTGFCRAGLRPAKPSAARLLTAVSTGCGKRTVENPQYPVENQVGGVAHGIAGVPACAGPRSAEGAHPLQLLRVDSANEQPSCARLGRPGGPPYRAEVVQ